LTHGNFMLYSAFWACYAVCELRKNQLLSLPFSLVYHRHSQHQFSQRLGIYLNDIRISRKIEFPTLQPFVPKEKTILVPEQQFDFVALSVAKDVHRTVIRTAALLLDDQVYQPIHLFSEIDMFPI